MRWVSVSPEMAFSGERRTAGAVQAVPQEAADAGEQPQL